MKRIVLLYILLCMALICSAQTKVNSIVANAQNKIVTRVVITLSEKTGWTTESDPTNRSVTVSVPQADASGVTVTGVNGNNLISELKAAEGGNINIRLKSKFFVETMSMDNPYRIIIDLFVAKSYTYQEHFQQAVFYEQMGKWNSAAKEYNKMLIKYPQNTDAHYYYAKLLLNQNNKSKAKEHLSAVPATSRYYAEASAMLNGLEGKSALPQTVTKVPAAKVTIPPPMARPVTPQPTASKPAVSSDPLLAEMEAVIAMAESSAYNDIAKIDTIFDASSTVLGGKTTEQNSLEQDFDPIKAVKKIQWWLWVLIILVITITVFIIVDYLNTRKMNKKLHKVPDSAALFDNETQSRMVQKLLADGWDASEIARELRMNLRDVETCIKQNKMNSLDDNER